MPPLLWSSIAPPITGLTATPKRDDNADTYKYFGEPAYVYSLREGIEDGFLTPFRVRQFASTRDAYVFDGADEVLAGEVEEGQEFSEAAFNRSILIEERELHRVRTLLSEIKHNEKTIIFCASQVHAALIRDLINQEVRHRDPNYCVRVTADDGAGGEAFLELFQQNSRTIPTILTTSQKLSTGVDAKNVRNIVQMRPINSMIEFKQIIGRGTRTFEGKNYFTVYDFVKAHEKFDDPEWDGDPADIIIDPPRDPKDPKPEGDQKDPLPDPEPGDDGPAKPKREMIEVKLADDHIVTIAATTFWGPDGKPISAQDFIKRMFGELPELFRDEDDLRAQWSDPDTRKALMERLAERSYGEAVLGVVRETLMANDSDLFDVLAHIAYSNSMRTREFRAEAGRRRLGDVYDPKIAAFLEYVLDSYVEHGETNLDRSKLNDFVKLKYGTAKECAAELGGMPAVIDAFVGFQRHLYSPSN